MVIHEPTSLLKAINLSLVSLRVFDVQQWAVIGVGDLHGHDRLVTGHELISDHFQVCLALRDNVLLGADLQQFKIPVDHLQLAQTVGGNHHFVVGIFDGLRFDLNVGYQIGGDLFQFLPKHEHDLPISFFLA